MNKKVKAPLAVLLGCLLAIGCLFGLSACSGGGSESVDKVYVMKTNVWEFEAMGQSVSQVTTRTLTLYKDGTYQYVHTMTLGTTDFGTGGYYTNVSFGNYTSAAEDESDPENTTYIITMEAPTRVIHHDAYSWGNPLYIDTADAETYPEEVATSEAALEYIRSGIANNYIGGSGTYSMTATVDNGNGEIKEVVEDTPEAAE